MTQAREAIPHAVEDGDLTLINAGQLITILNKANRELSTGDINRLDVIACILDEACCLFGCCSNNEVPAISILSIAFLLLIPLIFYRSITS